MQPQNTNPLLNGQHQESLFQEAALMKYRRLVFEVLVLFGCLPLAGVILANRTALVSEARQVFVVIVAVLTIIGLAHFAAGSAIRSLRNRIEEIHAAVQRVMAASANLNVARVELESVLSQLKHVNQMEAQSHDGRPRAAATWN